MNKRKVIIVIILVICLVGCFIGMKNNKDNRQEEINNSIDDNIMIEQPQEEKEKEEVIITTEDKEEIKIIPETYTVMYTTVKLHIRAAADINSEIIDTTNINEELMTIDDSDDGEWTKIKLNDNYYFVASRFLSNEKVEIKIEEPKQEVNNSNNYANNNNTGVLTKSKGVNYFNGHRETWYSQKVLPGGGLKIPGRHVDERGLVCDENGYICVASSDYSWGTIVETSLGTGRVYDSGCPKNTIDIYCDW